MYDNITEKNGPYVANCQSHTRAASPDKPKYEANVDLSPQTTVDTANMQERTVWQRIKEPGSVWQIILATLAGIALGLIVTSTVDEISDAAIALLAIPGQLWLRALQAVGMVFQRQ
jgi:hypothetical protein